MGFPDRWYLRFDCAAAGILLEERTGHDFPPPITHPEYYYGFIGVAVAWQILFLVLSRDPIRHRPMMIPAIVEKATFAIAVAVLFLQNRVPSFTLGLALVDSAFGVLFVLAYLKTSEAQKAQSDYAVK